MEPLRDESKRVALRQKKLAQRVRELMKKSGLSNIELSIITGIPTSRLSEIQNYEKYPHALSESTLERFIRKEIFSVADLKEGSNLSQQEEAYLDYKFSIVEDEELVRAINKAKEASLNVTKILNAINKVNEAGLDVTKILQKAIDKAKK